MEGPGSASGPRPGPGKAAECLSELNRIIEAQHALLERQKARIAELELQVAELRSRNARVHEEYQRHLRTCPLQHQHQNQYQQNQYQQNQYQQNQYQQNQYQCHSDSQSISAVSALTAIQEKPEHGGSTRMVRRHSSLPVGTSSSTVSALCRRTLPCRQWKSTSFRSVDTGTLHQYCCPAPLYNTQLAVPAPLKECREDNDLHRFCCPSSGSTGPSR